MSYYRFIYFILSSLLLSACGYQYGTGVALAPYTSITIPYVKNDLDGRMTAALVKVISAETGLQYEKAGGDLSLMVEILEYENENIGFRYDRKNDGQLRHSIIPTETRLFVVALVSLIETASGKSLAGPAKITAYVDFDHDYERTRNGVNVFSLGQLTDYDEAYDAALQPLYRVLSYKIADFVLSI
ncbi:MAG: hypothetical protein HWD61_13675 [Parachlamydiaceae bacterium]|nr:MAG: hypothetical protein HWD61_13675 [Parachlamydiaceae bacterium]